MRSDKKKRKKRKRSKRGKRRNKIKRRVVPEWYQSHHQVIKVNMVTRVIRVIIALIRSFITELA